MDDETKDFSNLNLNDNNNDLDNTIEVTEENLVTVKEQIKEIKKEEIDNKIEELKEEQNTNRKLSKTLIILIIVLGVLLISFICYLLFKKDKPTTPSNNTSKIVRPSESTEFIISKQNQITISCNKTSNGEKIKSLKKGMLIECDFIVNTPESISEIYFDIKNSTNLKLKKYNNDTNHTIVNDKNTYKISTTTPFNVLKDEIKFYFEVIDISQRTGYASLENIVYKDTKENYYKMIDFLVAFPPEYNDKIYIYKQTVDTETNYIGSKASLSDEGLELIDTFNCSTEECEIKNNFKNNFIIYDNELFVYDTLSKLKQTIKIEEDNLDYTKYEYETVTNKDGNLVGILFKNNYKENFDCSIVTNYCIEKSISGYNVSYYSLNRNMFTIALDYGFIGANIYEDYDIGLMLYKENEFGVFSYEEDDMILKMSNKYSSIEYESDSSLVKLGIYDSKNKLTYYKFYNPIDNTFTLDTKKLTSVNNSKKVYYKEEYNPQGKKVYMLYNSKGNALKDIPYITDLNQIALIDNNSLVFKHGEDFDIYDLDGNFEESSPYVQCGLNIKKSTNNFHLALNGDNELLVTDHIGKTLAKLMPNENLNDIYEVDTMNIVKCEEVNKELTVIITNSNIAEEEKNAYKFIVNTSGTITMEYIYYEQ